MKKTIFLAIVALLMTAISLQSQTLTLGLESFNTTAISNNSPGYEAENFNMQNFSMHIDFKLTPKMSFGLKPFVVLDNLSTSYGLAGTFSSDNFSLHLGGGVSSYKKGSDYRDPIEAKDQEKFWYARAWLGYPYFESYGELLANTNDLRFVRAVAMVRPLGDPIWGIGAMIEKNHPRKSFISGYTEFNLHNIKKLPGLTINIYGGLGGFNAMNGTELTGTFGVKLKWRFNFSISSPK